MMAGHTEWTTTAHVQNSRRGCLLCLTASVAQTEGSRPKALTRSEMADLARSLHALLDAVHHDELTASTATTYRLEGAVTALDTVLAGSGQAG